MIRLSSLSYKHCEPKSLSKKHPIIGFNKKTHRTDVLVEKVLFTGCSSLIKTTVFTVLEKQKTVAMHIRTEF